MNNDTILDLLSHIWDEYQSTQFALEMAREELEELRAFKKEVLNKKRGNKTNKKRGPGRPKKS